MKIAVFITVLTVAASSLYAQKKVEANRLTKQRSLLKEYALCKCLTYGVSSDSLSKKDFSTTVIIEQLDYSPEAYFTVDSLAKKFALAIPVATYIDTKGKKGIMINCIDYYNSSKLALQIKALDRFIIVK